MPYDVQWLVPDRVMYVRYIGVFTRDDLYAYLEKSLAMRDEANERLGVGGPLVHTLTDGRDMVKNEMELKDVQSSLRSLRHQKVGWSVFVHESRLNRFIVSIAHQLVGVRHYICATMDEAVKFLRDNDDTLPAFSAADIEALRQRQQQP